MILQSTGVGDFSDFPMLDCQFNVVDQKLFFGGIRRIYMEYKLHS